MKSKYLFATLAGFFMSNTIVTAADSDFDGRSSEEESDYRSEYKDRITAIADEFADRHDRALAGKEKRRAKVSRLELTAERKAALAALEAEKSRRKKTTVEFLAPKPASPTSPKTPGLKAEEAKAVSPKKTEVIKPSE